MKPVLIHEGYGMGDVLNPAQYSHNHHMGGFVTEETVVGMTKRGGSMDGVPQPHDHYKALVQHKVIESTAKTERRNHVAPASKAYNLLAKSGYKNMPNNHGAPVAEGIYKAGAKRGIV